MVCALLDNVGTTKDMLGIIHALLVLRITRPLRRACWLEGEANPRPSRARLPIPRPMQMASCCCWKGGMHGRIITLGVAENRRVRAVVAVVKEVGAIIPGC